MYDVIYVTLSAQSCDMVKVNVYVKKILNEDLKKITDWRGI